MAKRKPPLFTLSRLFLAGTGAFLLGVLFLFFLMMSAETTALRKARQLDLASLNLLEVLMESRMPESFPSQVRGIGRGMGGKIVLLDASRKPSYRNSRTLEKMQTISPVPKEWFRSPHGPLIFPWPPSSIPERLADQIAQMSSLKGEHHVLTNREGQLTPIQPVGGIAVWSLPIPNTPSCAQCHGFDSEILGHMVAFVPVPSFLPDYLKTSVWGFWPLPEMSQKIILGLVSGIVLLLGFGLVFMDSYKLSHSFRKLSEALSPDKGKSKDDSKGLTFSAEKEGMATPSGSNDDLPVVSEENKSTLISRLQTLDRALEKDIESLPRAGIQKQPDLGKEEKTRETRERFSEWTDQVEILILDLKAREEVLKDPTVAKALAKLDELKNSAIEMNTVLEEIDIVPIRHSPNFESLPETDKIWVEELQKSLKQLHAELRAIIGMVRGLPVIHTPQDET